MHEINFIDKTHFYIDVSEYDNNLIIIQRRANFHINTKMIEIFVLYDFFIFN